MQGLGTYVPRSPMVAEVQAIVAAVSGVTVAELKGPCRQRRYALPRLLAYHLARKHTKSSFPMIGRAFKRDHSTICVGVVAYPAKREQFAKLAAMEAECERQLANLSPVALVMPPEPPVENPNYVRWTSHEVETLRAQWPVSTDKEIARQLNNRHSPNSVRHKAANLGLLKQRAAA